MTMNFEYKRPAEIVSTKSNSFDGWLPRLAVTLATEAVSYCFVMQVLE